MYREKPYKVNENDRKILSSLIENPEGLRATSIAKSVSIKPVTAYKRLNLLRDKNIIENVFPIWKIANGQVDFCRELLGRGELFELHNMSYVVRLLKVPVWWSKRKNYLVRLKEWQFKEVNFGKDGSNPYVQLRNEDFVIQAYPESLIVIARKRYYSDDPFETAKCALGDVLSLLDWFCERFRFDFFSDGVPHVQVRNNDFNRINSVVASHVKRKGKGFVLELDGRRKVWVDKSEPFGMEANYPEGQEELEKVTKDILLNKPFLPSELQGNLLRMADNLNKVVGVQEMHAHNIVKHQKVLDEMLVTLKAIQKSLKR